MYCAIYYRDGISFDGLKYCSVFVDQAYYQTWVYDLHCLLGEIITEALCNLTDDAGWFPYRLQCDFDSKFVGGEFAMVLRANNVQVTAAPSYRQSQNGLVEHT